MMKTLYVLPLVVASGLLAVPEANALTLDNGRNINGRNMNGIAVHGTADEAVAAKAVSLILSDGERIALK